MLTVLPHGPGQFSSRPKATFTGLKNTSRRGVHGGFVILATLLLTACVGRYSGIRLYEMDLRLSVTAHTQQGRVGDPITTTFVVTNTGPIALDMCFEPTEQNISFYRAGRVLPTVALSVDHYDCKRRRTIGTGEESSWTVEMEIPDGAQGADEMQGHITVVDPISCESVRGCLSLPLDSELIPFQVIPRKAG